MADKPFFVIPLVPSTITTGNALASRPVTHLAEFLYKGMVWQSVGNASLTVTVDFATAKAIDFVSLMGANALPGTTIRVRLGATQAEAEGGAPFYDSGVLPFIDPAVTLPSARYHSHHELPSLATKRWLRIDIGGHTGDFLASMLVAGQKVRPFQYYEPQWVREIRDLGTVTFGRNAIPAVNEGQKLRGIQWKQAWITEAEMENDLSPLDEATGKTSPIYLCFDPAATTYRQRRTFFGFNEDNPAMTKRGFNRFERGYTFLSMF